MHATQQQIATGRLPLSETVPVIQTGRLVLRPLRLSDEKALTDYWTSERSRPNDGPMTVDQLRQRLVYDAFHWYYRGLGLWVAVDPKTGQRLVAASLTPIKDQPERADLGWDVLDPSAEGFGYASEVAGALLNHGRDLGFTDIRASMNADNDRSRRLATKLGGVFLRDYDRKGVKAVTYRFDAGAA